MAQRSQIPQQENKKLVPFERPKKRQLEHYQLLQQRMESGQLNDEKSEFATEIAVPIPVYAAPQEDSFEQMDWHRAQGAHNNDLSRRKLDSRTNIGINPAMFIGWAALAFALTSLFVMPGILGATAIILGMFAVIQGNRIGVWPVLIGFISIATSLLLLPFFS
ncbi:MAG: hypothetical protein H7X86_03945 [Gorillibacterium sp.]|nr:hypothetical protein [Gorillibacterium sp.]